MQPCGGAKIILNAPTNDGNPFFPHRILVPFPVHPSCVDGTTFPHLPPSLAVGLAPLSSLRSTSVHPCQWSFCPGPFPRGRLNPRFSIPLGCRSKPPRWIPSMAWAGRKRRPHHVGTSSAADGVGEHVWQDARGGGSQDEPNPSAKGAGRVHGRRENTMPRMLQNQVQRRILGRCPSRRHLLNSHTRTPSPK